VGLEQHEKNRYAVSSFYMLMPTRRRSVGPEEMGAEEGHRENETTEVKKSNPKSGLFCVLKTGGFGRMVPPAETIISQRWGRSQP